MPRLVLIRDIFAQHRREEIEIPIGYSPLVRVPGDWPIENTHVIWNGKRQEDKDFLDTFIFSREKEEIILRIVPGVEAIVYAIVYIAIAVALHFVIKALTPEPRANRKLFDNTDGSPSYGFDGVQNTIRNGTPISLLYGKHLVGGQVLSAYTIAEVAETEKRNVKDSKNELYMLLGLCAGPICGINNYTEDANAVSGSDISSDLKINNNDGTQFEGVEVSYRMGNWDQSIVSGFNDVTIQYSSGDGISALPLDLDYGVAQTYVTNNEIQAFELLFVFPSGLYRFNARAAFLQYEVEIQVRYRVYGSSTWTDLGNQTFSNKTRSQYIDSFRIDDLAPAQYEIEVTRQTADDVTYQVSTSVLMAINEIVYDDVSYKGIALVGVKALATEHLSGRQPTIANMVYGKECTVYHPDDDFCSDTEQDFGVDQDKLYWGWFSRDTNSNRDNIDYVKSHTIQQRKLIGKHISSATSTFESSIGWDAPFFYKEIYCDGGLDVSIYGDFVTSSTSDGDALALAAVVPDANSEEAHYIWIGLRNVSGTEKIYVRDDFSGTPAETSYTAAAGERYYRITFDGNVTWTVYSGTDGSSWTQRVQALQALGTGYGYACVGPAYWSTSSSPDIEVEFSNFVFADDTCYSIEVSSNPSWVTYDLLTDTHWGLGNYLDTSQIDLDTFQDFADYCNTLVSDGRGGQHRRHRFDGILDSTKGAWEHVLQILGNYRATILKQGDKIRVAWQRAQDPVQLFSMSNIKEGTFITTYQTPKLDANYWEIQFLNGENDYEQDFTTYLDPGIEAGEPYRRKTTTAYGITRVAEAQRHALFRCKTNRHITRAASFETGIDAIACEPYDVVSVQHDVPSWGESGRASGGSSTTVRLDKAVTLNSGTTYEISIRHGNDTIETQTVTSSAGLTDEITVSAFDSIPADGELWVLGEQNILTKDFLVMKIERTSDLECKLECAEYNADVYDDEITDIPIITYTALPDPRRVPGNVGDLRLNERAQIMKDGTVQSVIDVTFTRGRDAESYEIYFREDGYAEWLFGGITKSLHFVLAMQFSEDTTYEIAVVSVGPFGAKKRPHHESIPTAKITVEGDLGYPSDVSSITASRIGENVLLQWTPVSDKHILGYELRYSDTSTDWDAATQLATYLQASQYHATDFIADTYYFLVKAISRSGIYSENAASVQVTIPARPNASLSINSDERTGGWSGTKTNMTVASGDLDLDSGYTTGSYETAELDAGTGGITANVICNVVPKVSDRGMTWTTAGSWAWNSSNAQNTTWGITPDGSEITVTREFKYSNSSPIGGSYSAFQEGIYTGRYFQFKVTVTVISEAYKGTLAEMVIQADTGYT